VACTIFGFGVKNPLEVKNHIASTQFYPIVLGSGAYETDRCIDVGYEKKK
jgi:hypothetical protein